MKAQNIVVFNTEQLSPLFERVIIASGTSNRQTKALAASVRDAVKSKGFAQPRTEGEENGEWIIVDCGSAVVHVMQPAIRDYYRLEEIWGGKPVKLKVDSSPVKLVKASEEAAPAKRAAAKQAAAKQVAPAGKTPAAKKTPAAPRAAAAKKAAPAKKAAAARKAPVARKAAPAAKRPPAGKSAPAKKAPAKKAPAKRVLASKTPARRASKA